MVLCSNLPARLRIATDVLYDTSMGGGVKEDGNRIVKSELCTEGNPAKLETRRCGVPFLGQENEQYSRDV
jgi:hypothetical protein